MIIKNKKGMVIFDGGLSDLSAADLSGADLFRANLSMADLSEADLSGADLSMAYLSGANLSRANLSAADLSGADIAFVTNVWGGYFGKHFVFVWRKGDGCIVKIGCLEHPLGEWLENYREIGEHNNYSQEDIEVYGNFLRFIEDNFKKEKKMSERADGISG